MKYDVNNNEIEEILEEDSIFYVCVTNFHKSLVAEKTWIMFLVRDSTFQFFCLPDFVDNQYQHLW